MMAYGLTRHLVVLGIKKVYILEIGAILFKVRCWALAFFYEKIGR